MANNGFIYVNGVAFPYPSRESGLQKIATIVDSARNANGIVVSERLGRDQGKLELKWAALTPEQWSSMLQVLSNFEVTLRYVHMLTNDWVTRKFYVGDRDAQPFMIDPVTNKPRYYINCVANLIDTGKGA